MKFNKDKLKLISSVFICVLLIVVLLPIVTYGWFATQREADIEDFSMNVINKGTGDIGISFVPDGNGGDLRLKNLMPNNYCVININMSNYAPITSKYILELQRVTVSYPTKESTYNYKDNIVLTDDYYYVSSDLKVDNTLKTQELFREFVAPVSEALRYDIYYVDGASFAEGSEPNFITDGIAQINVDEDLFTLNNRMNISQLKGTSPSGGDIEIGDGIVVHEDGSFSVPSNKTANFYMVLHYLPTKYQTAEIKHKDGTSQKIELRNSNPYIRQEISLKIKYS